MPRRKFGQLFGACAFLGCLLSGCFGGGGGSGGQAALPNVDGLAPDSSATASDSAADLGGLSDAVAANGDVGTEVSAVSGDANDAQPKPADTGVDAFDGDNTPPDAGIQDAASAQDAPKITDSASAADSPLPSDASTAPDANPMADSQPAPEIISMPDTANVPDANAAVDAPAPPDSNPAPDLPPPQDAAVKAVAAGQAPPYAGVFPYLGCQAGGPPSQFVAEGPPPPSLKSGQKANVWVAFANCGDQPWLAKPAEGPVGHKLGAQSPQDNKNWGFDRVTLPGNVGPDEVVRVDFTVTAPALGGPTGYQWQIVNEGVAWVDAPGPQHTVDVQGTDPPPGNAAALADLWSGKAQFVVDQEPVPLNGVNSGHREAFAVNRTDLGPKVVYMYHRCFGQSAALASICLSISNDGVDSFADFLGEIVGPDPGHIFAVAPSVAKVGGQWVMVYEESNVADIYWAQSADGKQWTKKGSLLGKPGGAWDSGAMSTPSIMVGPDGNAHVFYAGMAAGGKSMAIGRADGPGPGNFAKTAGPVMKPPGAGWNGGQLSMPRVVFQNGWYYMVFEGADVDFTCEAYNKYGWGLARSQDLNNWSVLPNNPLGQSKGGCGQDMPSLFVRFDGHVFVFHTSADTSHVVREHLAFKGP